ncbi:hypothetical protein ACHQM5_006677 [Ranunculus cassubicifolius]
MQEMPCRLCSNEGVADHLHCHALHIFQETRVRSDKFPKPRLTLAPFSWLFLSPSSLCLQISTSYIRMGVGDFSICTVYSQSLGDIFHLYRVFSVFVYPETVFVALELALELTCMSLDAQVNELQMEIYPVLDELATSISTLNLERVRRFKGHLLALNRRVQKVRDEIEQLMDDDGDMAEMYLTEKKERMEAYNTSNHYLQSTSSGSGIISKSAPGNVQNQLIKFEVLLTAATFVAAIFAVVAGVFGMNFKPDIFDYSPAFNWVLVITGIGCGFLYLGFLLYFKHKRVLPF